MRAAWWRRRRLLCPEVARLLQRYLDEELAPARAAQVRAHLRDCRRCGLEAELYAQVKSAVGRRGVPLPDGSVERLRRFADALVSHEGADPRGGGIA